MIDRRLSDQLTERLRHQPAAVLLGPRQVGKTTLARQLAAATDKSVFLDLEREEDRAKLTNPSAFFGRYRDRLVILDEVQSMPNLFTALRPEIDSDRSPGRFLLLGSASGKLLRQSAESLAGRVAYLELTPLLVSELTPSPDTISHLWLRGGFPQSFLAQDAVASLAWRTDFATTLLARDFPGFGITVPADALRRFWRMCAHLQGQHFNASQLGLALGGLSHSTVARYLDWMVDAMLLRRLEPWHVNVGKRLVKSPKVYVRDSGLLHALLSIASLDDLASHPVAGLSWEGFVIEQLLANLPGLTSFGFYRTSAGAELDLVVELDDRRYGFEIKLSSAPKPSRGFWSACEDLGVHKAFVIAPVLEGYPVAENVEVVPISMVTSASEFVCRY